MHTTEIGTTESRLGTVKYVRLRKRWHWNPRKGLVNLVLLMFVLFFLLITFYYSATKSQGQALDQSITVEQGDTLWDIALHYYPQADPRRGVAEIRSLNNLKTAIIYPGQILRLPN